MHYIFESLFVGFYTAILWNIITSLLQLKLDNNCVFFILGFMKHYLGKILGLHKYYCNNGYACVALNKIKFHNLQNDLYNNLLLESIIEGLAFVMLCNIIKKMFKLDNIDFITIFIVGILLHIFAEFTGLHTYFCLNSC